MLILSGSPIIGSFDYRARVDFVRVPGVIKLRNGAYTSLNLHIDIEHTLSMRASIIQHTAEIFDPDVFIVDKEPLGLHGEAVETMRSLSSRGTRLVLGLRDVMDEPTMLVPEWERKNVLPVLDELYDDIWIYGVPQVCEPLEGFELSEDVERKIICTGYLPRHVPTSLTAPGMPEIMQGPYILVTTGGGGDGKAMVDWVIRAYEYDALLPYPALIVLGPFMPPERQAEFMRRVADLKRVEAITFDAHLEVLLANATGVVAMGGYNTFCEILSLDKRALVVPRTAPRLEQYIRASRAEELGLLRMLVNDGEPDPKVMAAALRELPRQDRPSEVVVPGLLEGLVSVNRLIEPWLRVQQVAAEAERFARGGA
ncbi:MAG: hypothetical protein V3U23_06210 [Kiloniellales bacterium]